MRAPSRYRRPRLSCRRACAPAERGRRTREILAQGRNVEGGGEHRHDVRRLIEQEYDRGMVHGVVTARKLHPINGHAEVGREPGDGAGIPRQSLELWIEGMHVDPE